MRIIKKYSNRRLYDTTTSAYVNLDDVAGIVRTGDEVRVLDAGTGEDLTQQVLLQVILEVRGGSNLLPLGLLHRVIRYSGDDPWQRVALQQLSTGLELLDGQVSRLERQFGWWKPESAPADASSPASGPEPEAEPERPSAEPDAEMDALRQRLAALEARLGTKD